MIHHFYLICNEVWFRYTTRQVADTHSVPYKTKARYSLKIVSFNLTSVLPYSGWLYYFLQTRTSCSLRNIWCSLFFLKLLVRILMYLVNRSEFGSVKDKAIEYLYWINTWSSYLNPKKCYDNAKRTAGWGGSDGGNCSNITKTFIKVVCIK